jgi:beta-N-acetylhexosaminidase
LDEIFDAAGGLLMLGWEGTELSEILDLVRDCRPGGLIFFRRNYPGDMGLLAKQLQQAQREARRELGRPLLLAVDGEGGAVKRLPAPFMEIRAARAAAAEGPEAVRALAEETGAALLELGFNLNLAPVLDVGPQDGPLGDRTFGDDPQTVAECGSAFLEGCEAAGILACGKHFPGLGPAGLDTHLELPEVSVSREEMEASGLKPFRALVAAGLKLVMTNHGLYPALDAERPTTFSPAATALLKNEIGFQGLILTDDLGMGAVAARRDPGEAAAAAAAAGHDLLLVCQGPERIRRSREALATAVVEGRLSRERLAEARARLEALWPALP